jgi:hypothetical protein
MGVLLTLEGSQVGRLDNVRGTWLVNVRVVEQWFAG